MEKLFWKLYNCNNEEEVLIINSSTLLSEPTLVSEQYLLDLEREAFLSLCGERKTLKRIPIVLKSGKPIRN